MSAQKSNRRTFLKQTAAAGSALPWLNPVGFAADTPPNVVFIICDQMRGDAMGCMNNPNARTPHLDRLAHDGVLMTRGFCNSPVCVPSRMSTFAGRYPHQTGRLSNRPWGDPKLDMKDTLVDSFIQRGYRTGWVGKNHTYTKEALDKIDFVRQRAREPFRKYSRFVPPHWHSDTFWPEEQCHPRKNTDDAIEFIQSSKKSRPFFLHISYFDPHPPYMAPATYTSRYCADEMQLPDTVPPEQLSGRLADYARHMQTDQLPDADFKETLRYYHAGVEWGVDAQVGRVMKALQENGFAENTIVVFTSDHGDFMGHYQLVRKGMFLYDALLHVPLIWHAPGSIQQKYRSGALANGVDIYPTLVELSGGTMPGHLVGRSLQPVLRGQEPTNPDEAIFTSAGYGHVEPVNNPAVDLKDPDDTPLHTRVMEQGMEPTYGTTMIRTHDFKYIQNEDDPPELYKLDGGIHETKNVIGDKAFSAPRKALEKRLIAWRKKHRE